MILLLLGVCIIYSWRCAACLMIIINWKFHCRSKRCLKHLRWHLELSLYNFILVIDRCVVQITEPYWGNYWINSKCWPENGDWARIFLACKTVQIIMLIGNVRQTNRTVVEKLQHHCSPWILWMVDICNKPERAM